MADIDPNVWYALSETRVDNGTKPLGTTLQDKPEGMRVFPLVDQSWQFQPVDGVKGRYLIRSSSTGVQQQLTACFNRDEIHPSRTRACLARSVSDNSQKWLVSRWNDTDGLTTYKFSNVANGTGYVLDVHPGADVFLSSEIDGETVNGQTIGRQVAQHWVLSSRSQVNDNAYSTIYSGTSTAPTATPTNSQSSSPSNASAGPNSAPATATSSAGKGPAAQQESTSQGLSVGAAAGIGVGATVAGLIIIGSLLLFWWKKRKAARERGEKLPLGSPPPNHPDQYPNPAAAAGYPHPQPQQHQYQAYDQHSMDPSKGGSPYTAYSQTAPTAVFEAPTPHSTDVHEAPAQGLRDPHMHNLHEMLGSSAFQEMDSTPQRAGRGG